MTCTPVPVARGRTKSTRTICALAGPGLSGGGCFDMAESPEAMAHSGALSSIACLEKAAMFSWNILGSQGRRLGGLIGVLLCMAAAAPSPGMAPAGQAGETPDISAGDENAVRAVVSGLLRAVSAGDAAGARLLLRQGGHVTSIIHRKGQEPRIVVGNWDDYLDGVGTNGPAGDERMGRSVVLVADGLASLWAPYSYFQEGAVRHCGHLSASLVRSDGAWRVQSLAWTVRTTDCPG